MLTEFSLVSIASTFSSTFDIFPSKFLCWRMYRIWEKQKQTCDSINNLSIRLNHTRCSCSICPALSPNEWMNRRMCCVQQLQKLPINCTDCLKPATVAIDEKKMYHTSTHKKRFVNVSHSVSLQLHTFCTHWTHPFCPIVRLCTEPTIEYHNRKQINEQDEINAVKIS